MVLRYRTTPTPGKSLVSLAEENRSGRSKAARLLIAPAIISASVHMVSLPGKSHYPAAPLFFCCFLLLECDWRAAASAPFNASDAIKDSSLNDVGLDGRARACPGAPGRSLASGHFASPPVSIPTASSCGSAGANKRPAR